MRAAMKIGSKASSIMTGTGPVALAGVVSVSWISTVISGYDELSTWPTSFFVMTGMSPLVSRVVLITSQRTLGVFAGMRPKISRLKSSTISGRRWVHHILAVVTRLPLFRMSGSGRLGYGFA